jgi:hypothetical protein
MGIPTTTLMQQFLVRVWGTNSTLPGPQKHHPRLDSSLSALRIWKPGMGYGLLLVVFAPRSFDSS